MSQRRHSGFRPAGKPQKAKSTLPKEPMTLTVSGLGAQGDGLARHGDTPVFIAGALPGETVTARASGKKGDGLAADLVSVDSASPDRVEPPCPHFSACGGCSLQHYAPAAEADWKREVLRQTLRTRGLDPVVVDPVIRIGAGTRQRATFAWRRLRDRVVLGYNQRASHQIIDLQACLLLETPLADVLPALRTLVADVAPVGSMGDLSVTLTDSGIDLCLDLPDYPGLEALEQIGRWSETHAAARIGARIDGVYHPLLTPRTPLVRFDGASVDLPPQAFLQPSRAGADALLAAVRAALSGTEGPLLDLFCGLGTFALPLAAEGRAVKGFDSETTAIAALSRAAKALKRPVTATVRDLFRDPVEGKELKDVTTVVLDPPRAGADAQCRALAEKAGASVRRVVMVSCSPATFARDARTLCDGGFRLVQVVPVDQFVWSPHLELVARFERD
ncbi:class I SAM-dependent RNA methyltransferase [Novispirillum itersonii]|uniref:23S rRNA (Uracil1939-C5)-methyltransferase n=1 Tax=Novispirillum itersonii TaxID=189 RepID=A0A7X0DN93_NOVIT|nr:class I SAM-dependent RNA methyltransferase [Novispirillum itersonii]MBB6210002.1 23S rRNA (uracil1939-C5)-methyltransferase [Novispirillum itersonii]